MNRLTIVLITGLLLSAGCATTPKPATTLKPVEPTATARPSRGGRIAADPIAFLRETRTRCAALDYYEVDFFKRERLGLLVKSLRNEEHMRVKFRAEPFSVKMTMVNEDHEFAETAYVDGLNGSKLRCRRRKAIWPGGTPPVNDYPPAMAVTFGKSINPITDFGVARLMERIIERLDQSIAENQPPTVEYLGLTEFEKTAQAVHHIRLTYPKEARLATPQVDLMFHADSLLPAASYTHTADGKIQGQYIYTNFDLKAQFNDDDFQIAEPQRV